MTNLAWMSIRDIANGLVCPTCGAGPGVPCDNLLPADMVLGHHIDRRVEARRERVLRAS